MGRALKRIRAGLRREVAGLRRQIRLMKQIEENQSRLITELETIYQASWRMQYLTNMEHLAQELISVLEQKVGYEHGAVLLIDHSTGRMIPYALSRQGRDETFVEQDKRYVRSHQLTVGKGLTGGVAQTGRSICLGDVREDSRYYSMREDIRSELCVPLMIGEQVTGVLNVETTVSHAYRKQDCRLLETVARQFAIILENQRLRTRIQQQQVEMTSHLENADEEHILTICASCKKIRDDHQQWRPVEEYFRDHRAIEFSHGICADCAKSLYPEFFK